MTTTEAAAFLQVKDSRVRQLCRSGELPAQRVGRDWIVLRSELEAYAKRRAEQNVAGKPGRPYRV